jgi:hypothetical protein
MHRPPSNARVPPWKEDFVGTKKTSLVIFYSWAMAAKGGTIREAELYNEGCGMHFSVMHTSGAQRHAAPQHIPCERWICIKTYNDKDMNEKTQKKSMAVPGT